MWACGIYPAKPHWGHLTSALWSCAFKCTHHANTVDCPLPGRGLGWCKKPQQDMVFVLIAQSLAIGCEWVFGLTAMWVHPCQACLPTLCRLEADVAGQQRPKLALFLCMDERCHGPHALVRDALALWLMVCLVWIPAVAWANCRCGSYCNVGAGMFDLRG